MATDCGIFLLRSRIASSLLCSQATALTMYALSQAVAFTK
jgi:hypothetical protein